MRLEDLVQVQTAYGVLYAGVATYNEVMLITIRTT
jgi:hypothetical protein